MNYIIEPKNYTEVAFCNGCNNNACNKYTNSSGNTEVKVDVSVKT